MDTILPDLPPDLPPDVFRFHRMVHDLLNDGPFANDDINVFLLTVSAECFFSHSISEDDRHKILYLFNIHLRPPAFSVRYPTAKSKPKTGPYSPYNPLSNHTSKTSC
jgi:hypothetical protein